ncbi:TlpA disulfide reductase family protein [Nocardioides sp.]|jgi:thiol-disulfide isomerase/thioredoxin|uniref:TlpA family protein disulfide reductase n=1 Tax=Nocardioides sp. TaxID=35761 RepID=UPI002CE2FF39|nr:TlpA disulfide reductase family protein [Nocardioides sp.]HVX55852.1 TlpA disulfide reductase family protein [Nocardioides sp.]
MRRLASLVLLLPLLAACGGLSGTNDGGYISGNGQVVQYAADQRGDAVTFAGKLLDGSTFDPASIAGKVTVVNIWGAWCGECIKEAALIQGAHQKLGDAVAFLGVDIRDTSEATPQAFERAHQITYPSIYSTDGSALNAVPHGKLPGTVPATLVLDKQGRVAAVIRGAVPSELTLTEVVGCVQDPSGQGCGT